MADKRNKRADRVWDRLIEAYGSRVVDSFGKQVPDSWVTSIDDLTDEQIIHGLRQVQRDSPIYPPTLGQFAKACADMPLPQSHSGPSVQELLSAYATQQLFFRLKPNELSRAATYVYREWWDATRPKGFERCAECTGIVINLDNGDRLGFSVQNMLADTEGHAKAVRSFRPGPRPSQQQVDAFRAVLPGIGK